MAVKRAIGALVNAGAIERTISGFQKTCQNATGKLESVKDKRCKMRLIPFFFYGIHNGQRMMVIPDQVSFLYNQLEYPLCTFHSG